MNKQEQYSEGIFVGYRWFDQQNQAPLFSFGYGLSYTAFSYSGLAVKAKHHSLRVSFTLKNTARATARTSRDLPLSGWVWVR